MNKKDFYIFLDIDGVLWDWPFLKKGIKNGSIKRGGIVKDLNKNCIFALNKLISNLNKKYNTHLVISSSWRLNMTHTIKTLYDHGLKYNGFIDRTKFLKSRIRGLEIKQYLNNKVNKRNYVVIDDETSDIYPFIPKEKVIKTNLYQSLNNNHIKKYLKILNKNNIEKETVIK
ncbi:MAG: HAD domain-containing protein [archaeon]